MKIAIASGKGGTGKTTLATNLAYYLAGKRNQVAYADCDVEEPNGHLFLKPDWNRRLPVNVRIPEFDKSKCDHCGDCSEICQYNAIAVLSDEVLFFPALCHSCGGCYHICPQKAITETDRVIGKISTGTSNGIQVFEGRLNIGEAISPPVIKAIRELLLNCPISIIDAPPGTSCPVIEAVRDTDFVVLVTEPTPFGLNDLKLAVGMVQVLGLPFGVVVNRDGIGDDRIEKYCLDENIPLILKIPDDRRIAEAYSGGKLLLEKLPEYTVLFDRLYSTILDCLSKRLTMV